MSTRETTNPTYPAARHPNTVNKTYPAAAPTDPARNNRSVSSLNAEYVVNPPRNPVTKTSRTSEGRINAISSAMKNEPTRFTTNVPRGVASETR